jgi:GAF domain-containing protein
VIAAPRPAPTRRLAETLPMQEFKELLSNLATLLDTGAITLQETTTIVGRHIQGRMGCSRLTFWTLEGEAGQRVMTRVGGFDGVTNTPLLEPATLTDAEFGAYFDALTSQGIYVCDDALADERLLAMRDSYLLPFGIRASLDAAISVNGNALGVLCCAQQGATRHWLQHEVTLLKRYASEISLRRARRLMAHEDGVMAQAQSFLTRVAEESRPAVPKP